MNYQELNKKIEAEYTAKRIKAEELASKNRERLNHFPAFLQLSSIEKQVIFELAKAKTNGKKNN